MDPKPQAKQQLKFSPTGLYDFRDLKDYHERFIKPCILGDIRALLTGLTRTQVGELDSNNRPHGGCNFLALGAILFACDHLGAFLVPPVKKEIVDSTKRLLGLFSALGKPYLEYRNLFTYFARHAIIHNYWPNSMIRFDTETDPKKDPCWVYVALGTSMNVAKKGLNPFTYEKKQRRFPELHDANSIPFTVKDLRECDATKWTNREVTTLNIYVNVHSLFQSIDDYFHKRFMPQRHEGNFNIIRGLVVRSKNFPFLGPSIIAEQWEPRRRREREWTVPQWFVIAELQKLADEISRRGP